jgi:hypothetical protein
MHPLPTIKPPNKRPSISRGSGEQTLPKKPLLAKSDRRETVIDALIVSDTMY